MSLKGDNLRPQNTNRTYCKSCIFHPDHTKRLMLSPDRYFEIVGYISRFEAAHECHRTEKACYGALEVQAKILFHAGIISEPSVESMLTVANKVLDEIEQA